VNAFLNRDISVGRTAFGDNLNCRSDFYAHRLVH